MAPPLFAWAEYNLYHKLGTKKRLREVLPVLERPLCVARGQPPAGQRPLFGARGGHDDGPLSARRLPLPRSISTRSRPSTLLFLSAIGDVLNDKDTSFKYKRAYFSLKTRISRMMWDDATGFYYDLDRGGRRLPLRTVGAFWTLLATIPNEEKSERLISYLNRPDEFGVEHPFPDAVRSPRRTIRATAPAAAARLLPPFNYMVIKGLERYGKHDEAREFALRHLYYVLDGVAPRGGRDRLAVRGLCAATGGAGQGARPQRFPAPPADGVLRTQYGGPDDRKRPSACISRCRARRSTGAFRSWRSWASRICS